MLRREKQWAFLLDVAELINYIEVLDFSAVGGELQRSYAEQQRKFDAGLSKARPGFSLHQKLQAIDIEFFSEVGVWLRVPSNKEEQARHREILKPLGDFWEGLDENNHWGGNFSTLYDPNHFERRD